MTPDELQSILAKSESTALEFKRCYKVSGQGQDRIRAEIAKDLLAMVNSLDAHDATGLIVIGVGDILRDGNRELFSIEGQEYSQAAFLDIFNSRCTPPLSNLKYEEVYLGKTKLGVLTVTSSSEVHSCSQDLVTPKHTWPKHSVLIRRGEQVGVASPSDIARMQREKSRWTKATRRKSLHETGQAFVIDTPLGFKSTIGVDAATHDLLIEVTPGNEKELREIIHLIFEDLAYIEPQELGMVMEYLNGIEEPLKKLREMGLVLFCVVRPELMQSSDKQFVMSVAHYFVVTKNAWFAVGEKNVRRVHAITDRCVHALKDFLKYMSGNGQIAVWPNLWSVVAEEPEESKYCTGCWETKSPDQLPAISVGDSEAVTRCKA